MIGDADLRAFRAGYYGLFVSLLWREPLADLLAALDRGIAARVAGAQGLNADLATGWKEIAAFVADVPAAARAEVVADEYVRLFLWPQGAALHPYESYYLTGRVLDGPLAVLRADLASLGIDKDPAYAEPEDFLAFELDVMRRLLVRQEEAKNPDDQNAALHGQAAFLKRHMLVWGPAAAADLAAAGDAPFYRGVGRLLLGFLELEGEAFVAFSADPVATIDEARQRFAGSGQWKGPLFDLAAPPGVEPDEPGER